MSTGGSLSESVLLNKQFKRKFSFPELYRSFVYAPRAIRKLLQNNKSTLVDKQFIERIQLAVTEVNGCAACSYQHTQMALKLGMSNEEISSFLSGGTEYTKPEESKGILFAQHFADTRAYPKEYAYQTIVEEYGEEAAATILSAAQAMIAGNMYGLPFSAFLSRLQGKPYKDSTLFYELGMLIFGLLVLPIAILHGFLRSIVGMSNTRFDTNGDS